MECYWSLTRRDVRPHHWGPVSNRPPYQQTGINQLAQSEGHIDNKILLRESDADEKSDQDGFDDDFAAELENEMMMQENKNSPLKSQVTS